MKKLLIQLSLGFIVAVCAIVSYLYMPANYLSVDNKIRDYLFIYRGKIPHSDQVTIVDIDERSLAELGQWPWERNKIARLLTNLAEAGVGIVGIDAVFAEPDNSSPRRVLNQMGLKREAANAPDFDEILGEAIGTTPTIAGYVFLMEADEIAQGEGPQVPAIFVERNLGAQDLLFRPHRPVLNFPSIQDRAFSSGYFNTIPDDDSGIIRNVPLVMKYDDVIYPSLSLEMIRIAFDEERVIVQHDPRIGVERIIVGDLEIPTDRYGRLFVNFRGAGKTFPYISAADIYNNTFDPQSVAGKFVLLGTSASGLLDLRAMPFDNVYPGVEIHANVIDNIITGDYISRPSWIPAVDLLMILLAALFLSAILAYASAFVSFAVIIVYTGLFLTFNYYMLFSHGLILNLLVVLLTIFLVTILALLFNYFLESKQKDLIRAKLAKKVSPSVVEDLLKNPDLGILEGRERDITIFFSDIRGFTSLSEAMGSPKALIGFLNSYMTPMTNIIMKYGGTVDKFIGDAIMAYWNAPSDVKNHQDAALKAAVEQLAALATLNATLKAEGKPQIDIGIGLNTGLATVGEMGSEGRADYTVIGDPVNLASRLEGLNKPYGSHIIISEFTKAGLTGEYVIRELDRVRVKGKTEPVAIYEVLGVGAPSGEQAKSIENYEKALSLYRSSDFKQALEGFRVLNQESSCYLYKLYIDRCEHLIENPPEAFDGVFTFTTK
ncbi:adenylate/guanylate cyclase domain-containing protein [Campylobacterota bacterium]|nr:adenylate/guanylate cyclase domain-containing protein [Campylobacterota bacterium]